MRYVLFGNVTCDFYLDTPLTIPGITKETLDVARYLSYIQYESHSSYSASAIHVARAISPSMTFFDNAVALACHNRRPLSVMSLDHHNPTADLLGLDRMAPVLWAISVSIIARSGLSSTGPTVNLRGVLYGDEVTKLLSRVERN